jgi:hypothetical protein
VRGLISVATGISAVVVAIGVWFWQHENSYSAANPGSELAEVLQWVGIGLALIGVAAILFGIALLRFFKEGQP